MSEGQAIVLVMTSVMTAVGVWGIFLKLPWR